MCLELRCARPIASMQGWTRRNPNPAIRESSLNDGPNFGMTVSLSNVHYLSLYSRVQNRLHVSIAKKTSLHRPLHSVLFLGSNSLHFCCAVFFFFLRTDKYVHSSKGSISQQKNYQPGQEVPTETCPAFPPAKTRPSTSSARASSASAPPSTSPAAATKTSPSSTSSRTTPRSTRTWTAAVRSPPTFNKSVRSAHGSQLA